MTMTNSRSPVHQSQQQRAKEKKQPGQQVDPQAPSAEDTALQLHDATGQSPLPWMFTGAPVPLQQPPQLATTPIGEDPVSRVKVPPVIQSTRGGGRPAPGVRRSGGGIQVGEHTGFLRMRGLPFSATKEDIVEFFQGHKIIPETIVMTYRGDGRATGEGYVGFETPDDSKAAMALHRNTIGTRYIELFISNKDEHSRAFARFGGR